MNIDCQWISKNLEALFCDGLASEEDRLARTHIESCPRCKEEVAELIAIDPLIKHYFQRELSLARHRRSASAFPRRVVGLMAAGVAVAAILFALVPSGGGPQTTPIAQTPAPIVQTAPAEPLDKADGASSERAKPSPAVKDQTEARNLRPSESAPALDSNAPDFVVTDPAGYSRTLADYRGYMLLIGVWSSSQPNSAANLERLYKTFGSDPKLRLIGVTNERQAKPANTTFPVLYNQGSRLLDTKPGEFVVLDESGTVRQRGSLVKDFESLSQLLRRQ